MGRGGMRFGAGRPAMHAKAEHCLRLDARHWAREGILQSVCSGVWGWTNRDTGERRASLGYRSDACTVTLNYAVNGESVSQLVPILTTPCRYGGQRYWFGCPKCGQQVAILYLRWQRFACRKCSRVAYASQSEDGCGRAWRKQSKIERRLDDNWRRPKGMHLTTYERLLDSIFECEEWRELELAAFLTRHGLPERSELWVSGEDSQPKSGGHG